MTKRRPSWSDQLRQAAALACGLLALNLSSAWAAGKASAHPEAAARKASARAAHGKAGHKPARSVVHGARPLGRNNAKRRAHDSLSPEVLTAEIKDDEATGLRGAASFYAYGFQGRRTATGELFKPKEFTAASNHFPLGTMVAVQRLDTNRCAIVKVNDRMHAKHRKRIIDVSRGVAEYLDMIKAGVVLVSVSALKSGWRERGLGACQAAFEQDMDCPTCEKSPRFPDFAGERLD